MNILLVDDDNGLNRGIAMAMKATDIDVKSCGTLGDARILLSNERMDLVILDVNLPDGNGLDLLHEIRQTNQIPVILLTANDIETDIVSGLELGADDYITKPFSLAVLRARVHTQLRKKRNTGSSIYKTDHYRFDFDNLEFYKNEQSIELSKTEQKLLKMLIDNKGRILSRESLMDRIWPDGIQFVDENALSVSVKRLRNKIEDKPSKPIHIKTIYGSGYKWEE